MNLDFTIDLQTTDEKFLRMAMREMAYELNHSALPAWAAKSQILIGNSLLPLYKSSPEYERLTKSVLRGHFGFQRGEEMVYVDSILEALMREIIVQPVTAYYRTGKITGGLNIFIFRSNFEKILQEPLAVIHSYKSRLGNYIKWLEWLLTEGDKIIVDGYHIEFGAFNPKKSRSQIAVMRKGKGFGWKVPIDVSGTIGNNWITRVLFRNLSATQQLIEQAVIQASSVL